MGSIRVAVLTISDRCSRGETPDVSGAKLCEIFAKEPFTVALYATVPDERKQISGALRRWSDEDLADVIITTGGTGLSPRDCTAESTRKVLTRELPGISYLLLADGLKHTLLAPLSQGVSGLRGQTMIINLPGSPAAATQGAEALIPILPHAVDVIRGRDKDHPVETVSAI
ncbi:MAG TPA: MogA/MoaB family molybdenum cofactor biosynthesis protein [Capsulimonadaceae bacterium]|jgi:molybdenum cofactor synthesis domain-containing protein